MRLTWIAILAAALPTAALAQSVPQDQDEATLPSHDDDQDQEDDQDNNLPPPTEQHPQSNQPRPMPHRNDREMRSHQGDHRPRLGIMVMTLTPELRAKEDALRKESARRQQNS